MSDRTASAPQSPLPPWCESHILRHVADTALRQRMLPPRAHIRPTSRTVLPQSDGKTARDLHCAERRRRDLTPIPTAGHASIGTARLAHLVLPTGR